MISNYNLDCGYHNFELKDKIYLVPDYSIKVIYTDGYNEVVFQGDSSNVTLLEGHEITFQEETSFDERFKFSKTLSIKVNGYKTFNDLNYRYYAIIETKDSEFYLVNVDFPSFVTHTYTLNANTNETELVFSSQSNIATLKLTNFEPNNVNTCNEYSTPKVKKFKLTESWASSLSTWQKSLINKGTFSDIEPLQDSISLTEEFDGEKYTVTLGFDIPMSYYKNDWHLKLLQFEENKYRGYISLEDGNKAFVGYNVGLFPSYTINGDIISIRLTETAIRGIAYGDDYAVIDTNIPNSIEFNGPSCYTYNWYSTCDWNVENKPEYITITPSSGKANTDYVLAICNTDATTGHETAEFNIKSCNANARGTIVVNNPMFRYTATTDVMCVEVLPPFKYKFTLNNSNVVNGECSSNSGLTQNEVSAYSATVVSVELGKCATYIDNGVFSGCTSLTNVVLSNRVTNIGNYTFSGCTNLASINIPKKVTTIGYGTFQHCDNLVRVNSDIDGIYSIPSGVTSIGWYAFQNCTNLESVIIGNGVTSIGSEAFRYCSGLTSVTIPDSVTSIGMYGFADCRNLVRVNSDIDGVCNVPSGVTNFGGGVFGWCSFSSATIPANFTEIPGGIFMGNPNLVRVNSDVDGICNIPSGVTSIGGGAFAGCSFSSATIPDSVTSIGTGAFNGCSRLTGITIPESVTDMSYQTFMNCSSFTSVGLFGSGASVEIPNSVTSIGRETFWDCSGITNVTLSDNITSIGLAAFESCDSLSSVTIGSGVTRIYDRTFGWCVNLTSLTIYAQTPPTFDYDALKGTPIANGTGYIYVPSGSVDAYKDAIGWRHFESRIQAIP